MSEHHAEQEHRVTPLELFFDLVFVFAFTQVTTVLAQDTTWRGVLHGLLILAALWWAWVGYAWLTNVIDPEEGAVLAAMLVATASMFVAALAVPGAFGAHGVLFGAALLIVNVMQVALFALPVRTDPNLLPSVLRAAWSIVGASGLILAAGFVHGPSRPILWLVALVIAYVAPLLAGTQGWRVHPAHFAERYGLILIIALGESIVAIGVGAHATGLGVGVVVAAVLGLVVAMSFWLTYFDFAAIRAQQLLEDRRGAERVALARDVYAYLHLPMVTGIVLVALAMRKTLAHVGDKLGTIPAIALCCGSALYLLAYVALRFRVSRTIGRGRPIAALVFAALVPLALAVPAIAALGVVAAVWVTLHTYELLRFREARAETRAARTTPTASTP